MNMIKRLQKDLPDDVDAALITSDVNRRYYTGMKSTAGILFITRKKAILIIDFRYIEDARHTVRDCEVMLQDKPYEQLKTLVKEEKVQKIAIEGNHMSVLEFEMLRKKLGRVEVSPFGLDKVIFSHRAVKTARELIMMREAQGIADKAFEELLNFIEVGVTEREVAAELEYLMRSYGGEGVSFDTIAVSGKNSSMPHGLPTDKPIEAGDLLTMDFGTRYKDYCSDTSRTVAIGHVSDEQKKAYDTVLKAQKRAFKAIKAGAKCSDVDFAARDFIENDAGYKDCFGHGLGHSLGLEIHEEPRFSPSSEDVLSVGNVLSVEPGIYIQGKFGIRIEDVVIVSESGFENITKSPKELIIL